MNREPGYLIDEMQEGRYIRAWKEGRGHGEYLIQIWNSGKPEGEPDGDWAMPGILGLGLCVEQAKLQTKRA